MADEWQGKDATVTSPARSAATVTPNDSADLSNFSRALWVGGAGDISVDMIDTGTAVTITNIPSGTLLPIRVGRVYSTSTTATGIVAFW